MKYVFECHICGEQANTDNILNVCTQNKKHQWLGYAYDGKTWFDENNNPIKDYVFEIKRVFKLPFLCNNGRMYRPNNMLPESEKIKITESMEFSYICSNCKKDDL